MWLDWLADVAKETGYPVVETPGWKTRGHGEMAVCEGVVGHHTGTPSTVTGDFPTLTVVRVGRSDLAGPLSHLGLGRNGTIYVIAAGCCYHAGKSAWDGWLDLNNKFIGIEAENSGAGDWTAKQMDAYPKLVAALLKKMQRGAGRYASHRSVALPAGRKDDPAKIADSWMRDRVVFHWNAALATPVVDEPWLLLPDMKFGDKNQDVYHLQLWACARYSYWSFEATGYYGERTQRALAEFQRRMGITGPDAIGTPVGPRTKHALWIEGWRR